MEWYLKVLREYARFEGRARRKEYWMFALINFAIALAIGLVETGLLGATFGIIGLIYLLAVLIPSLAVAVRRLHDTGRSGWWFLLVFLPLIGALVLIFFMVQDSQPGSNAYGPNPKGEGGAAPAYV